MFFFNLFESVADDRGWSDSEKTLLLQSVLVGKAQEAYISLSVSERKKYQSVKNAVLKVYELVAEAYRQHFRHWCKGDKQAHVDVVRELNTHFYRWLAAEGVSEFDALCDLIVLEQFKTIVPDHIATYINEHKVKTPAEAAVLADEFVLIHKSVGRDFSSSGFGRRERQGRFKDDLNCNYCLERGHWKNYCPLLRSKNKSGKGSGTGRPVALASASQPAKLDISVSPKSDESRPAGCAAPMGGSKCCMSDMSVLVSECPPSEVTDVDRDYGPFITDGFVSLVGSADKVAVKILRDTRASESFILESILPFSPQSSTGCSVLIKGIGLQTFSAPLHRLVLQ